MKITYSNLLAIITVTGLTAPAYAEENASNPLAAVNNTDLRFWNMDLGRGFERSDLWIDGAYMLTPKLKLKYELHYWETDTTGSKESGLETLHLKSIYFPSQGVCGDWKWKLALGGEWIVGLGNEDKGIGTGSDQLAPLAGLALVNGSTVMVPLIQHYISYDGPSVNDTAFRLIAIQSLPNDFWAKLDAKAPVQWDNNQAIPASVEVQLGKTFSPASSAYIDGSFGIGSDRLYDWAAGVGLRFNY